MPKHFLPVGNKVYEFTSRAAAMAWHDRQGFGAGGSNREESTEAASGSPPPRPTGTHPPQSLPRRKW